MNKNDVINHFAIVCDNYGNILEVISRGPYEKEFELGSNISIYIDTASIIKFFEFLKTVREEGYLLGYEINMVLHNNSKPVSFSGYYKEGKIYITVLYKDFEAMETLNEIIKMNNEYINQLRNMLKNQAHSHVSMDEIAYIEISRLNNELVNSKRLIEQQNVELLNLAIRDFLTGAYNRRYFSKKIYEEAEKAKQAHYKITLISIDFDCFKEVNDQLGHDAGDELLKKFVSICNEFLRKDQDVVFRLGGDEFIIMSLNQGQENSLEIMEKVNREFKKHTDISELSYGVIEILPEEVNDDFRIEKYLKEVDKRMYLFKQSKRRI